MQKLWLGFELILLKNSSKRKTSSAEKIVRVDHRRQRNLNDKQLSESSSKEEKRIRKFALFKCIIHSLIFAKKFVILLFLFQVHHQVTFLIIVQ